MRNFLIFLSIISITVLAETKPKKSLGLKIGPHFSTIRYSEKNDKGTDVHTFDYKAAPSVTFFLDLPISKNITHSFLLHYYQNYGKESIQLLFSRATGSVKLQYIGGGYTFKATLPIEKFVPYFAAGFSFDFLVDSEISGFLEIGGVNVYKKIDDDDLDKFTAQAIICGGVEYNLDNVVLFVEYGFSYNIIPFYSDEEVRSKDKYSYTSFGHTVSFGVKIPF